MAFDVTTSIVESTSIAVKLLVGKFTPVNESSPTVIRGSWIKSVARTAEGLWTLTVTERFRSSHRILGAFAQYQNTTIDAGAVAVGEIDWSAGTVKLGGWLAHVANDLAANTPSIYILLLVQSNQIVDGGGY